MQRAPEILGVDREVADAGCDCVRASGVDCTCDFFEGFGVVLMDPAAEGETEEGD